jgi:hypothetical protein
MTTVYDKNNMTLSTSGFGLVEPSTLVPEQTASLTVGSGYNVLPEQIKY